MTTAKSSSTTRTPAMAPASNRVISHWVKLTPEEGIQVLFRAAEVLHNRADGVLMTTHPPSAERPCQWEIALRLAHPPTPATTPPTQDLAQASASVQPSSATFSSPSSLASNDSRYSLVQQNRRRQYSTAASKASATLPLPVCVPAASSTLLVLTMDRKYQQDMGTGTGVYVEDPAEAGRKRCDRYRTLYIYSPKLKRDICAHPIKTGVWPQTVVFDAADVTENYDQDYHFQIWLAGASPRQQDVGTSTRLNHCHELLWAMRKDVATANVKIVVRDTEPTLERDDEETHSLSHGADGRTKSPSPKARRGAGGERRSSPHSGITDVNDNATENGKRSHLSGEQARSGYIPDASPEVVFRAHKCILETTVFFSRMLNGNFKEAQADEKGVYSIELSSDMFDAEIMDHLLDYIYTREPIEEVLHEDQHHLQSYEAHSNLGHLQEPQEPQVHHVISANVGLNLETIITETRATSSAGLRRQYRHRSHHQCLLATAGLTLYHWGALYRAAAHLEDKELQKQTLRQIQAHLDPETTLEQMVKWGHQHEEVKSVMLKYLIQKRRDVFGDEQRNKLRPYLWAEYEDQVETLVEITSQIARQ